jgi:hypothetical protein
MKNTEQAKKSEGGMARRMNDFYFELKSPDGKVEVFEGKGEEIEEDGLPE